MRQSHIAIIGAPMDLGAGRRGVDMGPSAIRLACLNEKLSLLGYQIHDLGNILVDQPENLPPGPTNARYLPQIAHTCERAAEMVERAVGEGRMPLVLGGDHSIAIGTVTGVASYHRRHEQKIGLIWIDAHADMNTPESSPSGNVHGMPLACLIGSGPAELTNLGGFAPKVAPQNVAVVGLRSVDDIERETVRATGVHAFTMRDIDERGLRSVMREAIVHATAGTAGFHLSFDMDAVDPAEAPGVGTPVRGGITYREAHLAMETVCDSGMMVSMEIVEVNPVIDSANRTALLAVELVMSALGKRILEPESSVSKIRVAVLYGGRSGEHEVSLRSAESIMAAMDRERYEILPILIEKNGRWQPRTILPEPGANPGIDVVFPALHGTFGEDGTVQGLLELADLAYVGAGVLGSAVSMDKEVMKRLLNERGLPVVEYMVLRRGRFRAEDVCGKLPFPVFVKPANLGSSVGVSKARTCEELMAALESAAQFDRKILIERGIEGREFECSVLGNEDPVAAVPCEILASRDFYDYEDKYLLEQARTVVPADLTAEQTREVQRLAVECYRACECEGMARVDFLMEGATGKFFINEPNTIPGFTSISMYPKMWEASGLSYSQLIDRLIELALDRHRDRRANRYFR